MKTGYQTTFSFLKPSSNIQSIFPVLGDIMGYRASEFPNKPPHKVLYTLSDWIDASDTKSSGDQFYACMHAKEIQKFCHACRFINKTPWVVSEAVDLKQFQINRLPLSVTIYNKLYELVSCAINTAWRTFCFNYNIYCGMGNLNLLLWWP